MLKVSVIIPSYQHGDFLRDAIDSVLAQTYKDYELIVVDDGSTDGTKEIAAEYRNQIKYIYQDNRGLPAARNTGILASKGEYMAFLDADDVWLPNKLKLEVESLDTHLSVGMVYSDYTYFGTRAAPRRRGFDGGSPVSGHILKELFLHSPISSSAVLVRKKCFDKVGFFDESLVSCEDLDMWLRIAKCFEIDYIGIPLARYRLHERNMYLETERMLIGQLAMRRKCLEFNPFLLGEISSKAMHQRYYGLYRALGNWYLYIGVPQKARETFREYLRLYSRDPVAYILWLITFLPPRLSSWMLRLSLVWDRIYRTRRTRLLKTIEKLIGPRAYGALKSWWHALKDK